MAERDGDSRSGDVARVERAWREHRTLQILRGLELTPLEGLRWLEDNRAEMRAGLGRAQRAPQVSSDEPSAGDGSTTARRRPSTA